MIFTMSSRGISVRSSIWIMRFSSVIRLIFPERVRSDPPSFSLNGKLTIEHLFFYSQLEKFRKNPVKIKIRKTTYLLGFFRLWHKIGTKMALHSR